MDLIEFDCSLGEGGGQVLRTALSVSTLLQKPIKLINIRKGREKQGLRPQHLTAVQTLAKLSNAELEHCNLNSTKLFFNPKKIQGGTFSVNIKTAGSITLLLQTIFLSCLFAEEKISLRIVGGTDVPFSPSFNYFKEVFMPIANKMGCNFEAKLIKHGFNPLGNGVVVFESSKPKFPLKKINLTSLGEPKFIKIFSNSSGLPKEVALNQAKAAKKILEEKFSCDLIEEINSIDLKESIGSVIDLIAFYSNDARIGVSELGVKGVPALKIGEQAALRFLEETAQQKPVDRHLVDQLLPLMAIARGKSEIETTNLTMHAQTNMLVLKKLLNVDFQVEGELNSPAKISCNGLSFEKTILT